MKVKCESCKKNEATYECYRCAKSLCPMCCLEFPLEDDLIMCKDCKDEFYRLLKENKFLNFYFENK